MLHGVTKSRRRLSELTFYVYRLHVNILSLLITH